MDERKLWWLEANVSEKEADDMPDDARQIYKRNGICIRGTWKQAKAYAEETFEGFGYYLDMLEITELE